MFQRILITLLLLSAPIYIQAQNTAPEPIDKKIYLELRPIQFLLNGYSIVGHYALNDRIQVGVSLFAATLSNGITDFVWDTTGLLDLEARQDIVFGLSFRYFLNKNTPHERWFLGAAGGTEFYSLTNRIDSQEVDYTFFYLAPRLGYLWHPIRKKAPNLYISAEFVAVFPLISDGEASFNSGGSAEINSLLPSPLIGIGYRF